MNKIAVLTADGGKGKTMNDKITLSRGQWELLRKYIIWTERHRKNEVEIWQSINFEMPSEAAQNALATWKEMDLGLETLLNTIE